MIQIWVQEKAIFHRAEAKLYSFTPLSWEKRPVTLREILIYSLRNLDMNKQLHFFEATAIVTGYCFGTVKCKVVNQNDEPVIEYGY